MGSTRRGNARGLVALVAAVTFVPLGLFLWLGARLLQQDRALEKQQARDRLQTTGDLIVAALQRAIASSEQKVASGSEEWRDGAVLVTFFPDRVEASPRARLAYLPVVTSLHHVPAEQFRAAELLEFQSRNRAAAIAAYRHLAESPDARVRAGALLRLARNYASANRIDDARAAYAQLSVIDDIAEGDVPVGLAASWARCVLLERLGNDSALRDEAVRLQTDMLSGRWRITEPIYVTYMTDAERWAHAPPPDRRPERFADAVLQVWAEHSGEGPVASASSRYSVIVHGEPFTVLSQTSGKLRRALIAAAPFIASEWLKSASAVAVEQAAAFQIEDSGSGQRLFDAPRQPAPGTSVVRIARAQSELPWNVAVWSVDAPLSSGFQSRRRLLLTGFALLATLSLTAGWLIIRAVRRELAVARLQSDFVAAVSHEFRTPLTALRQFTAVLQEQRGLDEERRRVCYDAQARATDRLMRLVESVLDFGRMEAGARPYRFEPRDCSDMVQRVVDDFTAQPQMAERRVSFNRNGTVPVAADDEALSRALWNLLDNAVKYSPAGGPLRSQPACCQRARRDFRPRSWTRHRGTRAAENLREVRTWRGRTNARNRRHRNRPRHGGSHRSGARRSRRSRKQPRTRQHVHDRHSAEGVNAVARILVAEDEPDIALGLQLDLRNEGYDVEIAANGDEAARRGREPGWDVILLDVMLPFKDGFEVCRDLRRAKVRTPILMLTAKTQDAEKVLGLDMGADDYVTKPFSPRELRARIRALLRRARPGAEQVCRVGDCEIDFGRAEVRRDRQASDLTAIELKMLEAFLRHPGRVITRAQIINDVWGDVFVTDRVVDTHVVKLRRKIEANPNEPQHIVSVRGIGYRFES